MKNKILLTFVLLICVHRTNGQDYWKPIATNLSNDLYSVSFGDEQTGYICGSDSLLLKSIDGGKIWNRVKIKGIVFKPNWGNDLVDVKFVSTQVGYIVQGNHANPIYQGVLYKTTDGGLTWTPNSNVNIAPRKIFYFNEDNGYQVGSAFFQGKMVGKQVKGNWQNINGFSWNPAEAINAIDFYDTFTGIIGGDSGYVYRTFDGGISWDTVKASIGHSILCLRYLSRYIIIGGTAHIPGYASTIFSIDGGKAWVESPSLFVGYHPEIHEIIKSKRDSVISVGEINQKKGFIEWMSVPNKLDTAFTVHPLNSATMKNDSIAFIVGDSGAILCNGFYETNSISNLHKLPLTSVFPNPVSYMLTIQSEGNLDFQLLSMDGRLVESVTNCNKEYRIDASGYAKGVYHLRLVYKDNQSQIFKVVIE